MKKSPEDYFAEQNFSVRGGEGENFTPAERAFLDKYMGMESAHVLEQIGLGASELSGPPTPDQHLAMAVEEDLNDILKREPEIQMVAFFIGGQEFTIPTVAVQEVIRFIPPAKLPAAPPLVAGVVNLRGRVTPLLLLRDILGVRSARETEDRFIIVCRRRDLQVGLLIERVHTMYRVSQSEIEWNVEMQIGSNAEYVAGLLKVGERLVSVISVDRMIAGILK